MRTLEFHVDGQLLKKAPGCDFSNIVPGSRGYLDAKFTFSSEWDGCTKAASFWHDGKEYAVLLNNDVCAIPDEALVGRKFEVSVTGVSADGYHIPSSKTTVRQEG